MVAQTAKIATDNAKRYTSNSPGMCLKYTRTWLEIASYYGDAATAWKHCKKRHPGDRNPPKGAPVLWTGGSHGYGHAALSMGGGKIRTTDATSSGQTSTQDLSYPERVWGLTYAGWAEDLNTVTIPYLGAVAPAPTPEVDDMPNTTHLVLAAAQQIGPEYEPIHWKAASDPGKKFSGDISLNIGGCPYSQTLGVMVDAPAGAQIYVRTVEATKKGDGYAITENNQVMKATAPGGVAALAVTTNQAVAPDARLRWQIMCSAKATLSAADAVVLWWP